ncbi:hypothetical protein HK102_008821 [Quaeritorhiza haematococci]|nr:hypothetical protein HK102_008821 [Quaeritorhiza haematococci]
MTTSTHLMLLAQLLLSHLLGVVYADRFLLPNVPDNGDPIRAFAREKGLYSPCFFDMTFANVNSSNNEILPASSANLLKSSQPIKDTPILGDSFLTEEPMTVPRTCYAERNLVMQYLSSLRAEVCFAEPIYAGINPTEANDVESSPHIGEIRLWQDLIIPHTSVCTWFDFLERRVCRTSVQSVLTIQKHKRQLPNESPTSLEPSRLLGVPPNMVATITCIVAMFPQLRLVLPLDKDYRIYREGQRTRIIRAPGAIVFPSSTGAVRKAVQCAWTNKVQPVPRSGGHSYEAFSSLDGSLVIDLSEMDSLIDVNSTALTATVQAGIRMGPLYYGLWNTAKLTFNGPPAPSVGLAGFVSGGGFGLQSRFKGLGADRVLSMDVVTCNGSLITASRNENPDLFWALRGGGGGSFGIVTSYTLEVFPWKVSDFAAVVTRVLQWGRNAPRNLGLRLLAVNFEVKLLGHYQGPLNELQSLLDDFGILNSDVGDPTGFTINGNCTGLTSRLFALGQVMCREENLEETLLAKPRAGSSSADGEGFWALSARENVKSKSEFASSIPPTNILAILGDFITVARPNWFVELVPFGGFMDDVGPQDTPYPHRNGTLFSLQYGAYVRRNESVVGSPAFAWLRALEVTISPYMNGMHYQNYPDLDLGRKFGEKYFGTVNFARLKSIKAMYDPCNVWRNEQSVPLPYSSTNSLCSSPPPDNLTTTTTTTTGTPTTTSVAYATTGAYSFSSSETGSVETRTVPSTTNAGPSTTVTTTDAAISYSSVVSTTETKPNTASLSSPGSPIITITSTVTVTTTPTTSQKTKSTKTKRTKTKRTKTSRTLASPTRTPSKTSPSITPTPTSSISKPTSTSIKTSIASTKTRTPTTTTRKQLCKCTDVSDNEADVQDEQEEEKEEAQRDLEREQRREKRRREREERRRQRDIEE